LVQKAAERVDIGSPVDQGSFDLLRSQVRWRSDGAIVARPLIFQPPTEAEVGDVDVIVSVHEHVRRLDVAVDKAFRVRRVKRGTNLTADRESTRSVQSALVTQESSKIRAVDKTHREIEAAVHVARVVDRDDVRMLERHGELRLTDESRAKPRIESKLGRYELEGNGALQSQVVGAVDDTHRAATDQRLDSIADEVGPDLVLELCRHGLATSSIGRRRGRANRRAEVSLRPV